MFTLVNNSNEISVQIDDKVIVLGESSTTPTEVKGGMFYSGSDEWFLGMKTHLYLIFNNREKILNLGEKMNNGEK